MYVLPVLGWLVVCDAQKQTTQTIALVIKAKSQS